MYDLNGEWNYINTITAPPASGQIRMNNTAQQSPTLMWVHKVSATGVDTTNFLSTVEADQELYIQDKDDATKWQAYRVTGPSVNASAHFQFPIAWVRGSGTVPQQRCILATLSVVVPPVEPPEPPVVITVPVPTPVPVPAAPVYTLRQFYASQIAIGFISSGVAANLTGGQLAEWSFKAADSMIQFEFAETAGVPSLPAGSSREAKNLRLRRLRELG